MIAAAPQQRAGFSPLDFGSPFYKTELIRGINVITEQ
jgi:hypothetical protein